MVDSSRYRPVSKRPKLSTFRRNLLPHSRRSKRRGTLWKCKVKLSLYLINYHTMKTHKGNGCIKPCAFSPPGKETAVLMV
jgi:hypothetical protein